VVAATSLNRLVADLPHAAAHVEAPGPDIIMRRFATSERTMTPAKALRPGMQPEADRVTVDMTLALRPSLDNAPRYPHLHRHCSISKGDSQMRLT
jgi:hypothetical protein